VRNSLQHFEASGRPGFLGAAVLAFILINLQYNREKADGLAFAYRRSSRQL